MRQLLFIAIFLPLAPRAIADVSDTVSDVLPDAIEIRHSLHSNPELSNREFETAKLVADYLRALDIEVQTGVAHTGVVGLLKGGQPGPLVAVRADMDALPVTEATDLEFRSTKRTEYQGQDVGVSHACGHDIHVSVGLGVAAVLAEHRDQLTGSVLFIFQPAEEGAPVGEDGGAELMLKEGLFESHQPEAIFALHAFPDFEVGEIGFAFGPVWASADRFHISLNGRQAHGAWPHLSVDPVVMAAQTVLALQTIPSRNIDPKQPAVVTVGVIRGGERFNIIPGSVQLQGTVRTYDTVIQDVIEKRMREIVDGITQAAGGTYDLEYTRVTPYTRNDTELTAWARQSLAATIGAENVIEAPAVMGAEDFAFFANEVPSFYFWLGIVKPGTQSGALHTPTFRADDSAVEVGIRAMTGLVIDFLNNPSP